MNRLKALAILALERMNLINININILFDLIRNNIKENFVCVQNLYMDFADLRAIKEIVPIRSRLEKTSADSYYYQCFYWFDLQ